MAMGEYSWSDHVARPSVLVCLTERQWDVVREALYRRGTQRARDIAIKIAEQGGGSMVTLHGIDGRPDGDNS